MAISKIKVGSVEHELQTTIANVDNLQATLDDKANKSQAVFYVEGSGTTDTTNKVATWTGTHSDITQYYPGLMIAYKISTAGSTTTTLNINNLGAVNVVKNATSAISTSYAVNSVVLLVYTLDGTTAYWKAHDYDANTRNTVGDYTKNSTKLYFVGTTSSDSASSSSYATSYTNSNIYVNTSNVLYSAKGFSGDLAGNATTATSATSATKATQDASGNVITSTYETKTDSASKLEEAKTYTNSILNNYVVKLSGSSAITGNLSPKTNNSCSLGTSSLNWNSVYASTINPDSIEFKGSTSHGGYIDFHYGSSTADNTSRIIESASGVIDIVASNGIKFNSGALSVVNGGTGATTFTSGRALIGAGTGAVTTRAITNNTATSSAISGSTNLVTMNTLKNAINRTTSVAAADTNYTTLMARGSSLNATETTPTVNGAIAWTYE